MACVIRDACDGDNGDVLFCDACVDAVTAALREAPALLKLLQAETPKTLARPLHATPTASSAGPSSPAREHFIDLGAELVEAIAEWSAITGRPPARTLPGISSACSRLAASPYRYLAALGGIASAQSLLRATRAARRTLALTVEPRRLPDRCPSCGTRGLTQLTEYGPASCDYCDFSLPAS